MLSRASHRLSGGFANPFRLVLLLALTLPAMGQTFRTPLKHGDDDIRRRLRVLENRIDALDDGIRDAQRDIGLARGRADEFARRLAEIQPNLDEARSSGLQAARDKTDAARAFTDARAASTRADAEYRQVRKRLIEGIEVDPDLVDSLADFKLARERYFRARAEALAPLRATADYLAAQDHVRDAHREMDALKTDADAPRTHLVRAANDLLKHQGVVTAMENRALERNDKYALAWVRWIGAVLDLATVRAALVVEAYNDPQHLAAMEEMYARREAVEAAEEERKDTAGRLTQIERAFRALSAQYDAAAREHQKALGDVARETDRLNDLIDRRERAAREYERLRGYYY